MLHAAPLEEDGALAGEVRGLSVAGFTWVVLHRDRAKTPDRAQALLERALGVPDLRRGEAVAWRIHSTPEGSVDGGLNL